MEHFCGSDWQGSFSRNGDLLPCMQSLLLQVPPPLLVMLPAGVWRLWCLRERPILVEHRHISPRLPFLLVALQLLFAFVALIYTLADDREPYLLLEFSAAVIGWIVSGAVMFRERRCQMGLHPVSRVFWVLDWLTASKVLESTITNLARGEAFDDSALLTFIRWPLSMALFVFALVWRARGYDEHAEPEMNARSSMQGGGMLSVRSPRQYLVVSDEEAAWPTDGQPRTEQGLWGRFMAFTGRDRGQNSLNDDDEVGMNAVNTIASSSFVRQHNTPLPRASPTAAARRDPTTHPLYDADVSIPSFTESQGLTGRVVVQFTVRVQVRSPRFASGDRNVDTLIAHKKYRELEGFRDIIDITAQKLDIASPPFPAAAASSGSLEQTRQHLEMYLRTVMEQPVFWNDVSDFVALTRKLELIKSHVAFEKRRSAANTPVAPSSMLAAAAASGAAPLSVTESLPAVRSRDRQSSVTPFVLIGVNVRAWMRWEVAGGAPVSPTPGGRSRNSSLSEQKGGDDASPSASSPGSTYVTFQINVRSSNGAYNVHKRLSEITALRAALVARMGGTSSSVPSLTISKDFDKDDASLQRARRSLEIFLQSIVGVSLFECNELFSCLAEQGHPVRRITSDRMIACSDPSLMPVEPPPSAAVPSALSIRTESIPIAGSAPKQAKMRDGSSQASSVRKDASSTAAGVSYATSPILSQSISAAEVDYFAAKDTGSPADGGGSTIAASPISRSSVSRRVPPPGSSPPSHHASSYLDADNEFPGDGDASHSSEDDDDDSEDEEATEDRAQASIEQSSRGVLPSTDVSGAAPLTRRADGSLGREMPAQANHRFAVYISHWTRAQGKEGDAGSAAASSTPTSSSSGSHVVFHIVVKEFFELGSYLQWVVLRRFTQFLTLRRALREAFPHASLPKLPAKQLFSMKKQSTSFLNARRAQLELWLQQLINNNAFQGDALFAFFEMSENRSAAHMRLVQSASACLCSPVSRYVACAYALSLRHNASRVITMGNVKSEQPQE